MVRLGKVRETEIDREGLCEAGGVLGRDILNDPACWIERGCLGATGDGKLSQRLDGFKEGAAFLFPDDVTQQASKTADVTVQRAFFEVRCFA
jgi:hypothetical protein